MFEETVEHAQNCEKNAIRESLGIGDMLISKLDVKTSKNGVGMGHSY